MFLFLMFDSSPAAPWRLSALNTQELQPRAGQRLGAQLPVCDGDTEHSFNITWILSAGSRATVYRKKCLQTQFWHLLLFSSSMIIKFITYQCSGKLVCVLNTFQRCLEVPLLMWFSQHKNRMGRTEGVMAIGAIPHYTMVFIKVGYQACLRESGARSGHVKLLRGTFSTTVYYLWCGTGFSISPPQLKFLFWVEMCLQTWI